MTLGQTAANAQFTIDGVAFSRKTNIVDDVVPGMSLTLKKVPPDNRSISVRAARST